MGRARLRGWGTKSASALCRSALGLTDRLDVTARSERCLARPSFALFSPDGIRRQLQKKRGEVRAAYYA
jgi:hypothetical protein